MDARRTGPEPTPEFRLSAESAREVTGGVGPARAGGRFLSTDHLSTEAAAAYVDRRLPQTGQLRADTHLARCPDCRREVETQRQVRRTLRDSGPIHMPSDLRDRLSSIAEGPVPEVPETPEPEGWWSRLVRRLRRGDR